MVRVSSMLVDEVLAELIEYCERMATENVRYLLAYAPSDRYGRVAPHFCLPVPRRGYHGLYITVSPGVGKALTHDQNVMMVKLQALGYETHIVDRAGVAVDYLREYMED